MRGSPPTGAVVDAWNGLFRDGPTAMTESFWEYIAPQVPDPHRVILKHLVEHIHEQVRWIATNREALVGETGRAEEIGKMMHRAGLRSYTDDKGRIYVAEDRT